MEAIAEKEAVQPVGGSDEERIVQLETDVQKAQEGIAACEKELQRLNSQKTDLTGVYDQSMAQLSAKLSDSSVGQIIDAAYTQKLQPVTQLGDSIIKMVALRNAFRKQLKLANEEIKRIQSDALEVQYCQEVLDVAEGVRVFVRLYNSVFAHLEALKGLIEKSAIGQLEKWDEYCEKLGLSSCYAVIMNSHLRQSYFAGLDPSQLASQINSLHEGGTGSYPNFPEELRIDFNKMALAGEGYYRDNPMPAKTQAGRDMAVMEALDRALNKVGQAEKASDFWKRPRSRVVG
jgi:hypothetical protein